MSELEFNEVKINKCSPDSQPRFGRDPVRMICSVCSQEMTTKVERKPSIRTSGIQFFFYCIICVPCCCITGSMKEETKHFCSNCDALVGTHTDVKF